MKFGSALAAFALFGKSIAISLSSDAALETGLPPVTSGDPSDPAVDQCFLYESFWYTGKKHILDLNGKEISDSWYVPSGSE